MKKFNLIEHYFGKIEHSIILNSEEGNLIISNKTFIENIQFDLTYFPLKHLGYKVVTTAISEIIAKNAYPKQLILNLMLSDRFSEEALDEFFYGVNSACKHYDLELSSGDLASSNSGMIITVTAAGIQKPEKIVKSSGAQLNDLICVTGDLGAAYAGLLLLEREKAVFMQNPEAQPDLKGYEYPLQRQLKPEARIDLIKQLEKEHIIPTSMLLVSDGLSSSMLHICKSSQVGCRIVEEKLPIDEKVYHLLKDTLNIVPSTAALNGGEDNEILLTIAQSDFEKIRKIEDISIIGYICDASEKAGFITNDNCYFDLQAQGWE